MNGSADSLPIPTPADIDAAAEVIYRHLRRTPLHHYPALSRLLGCDAYVKHENHQPVGAFKVRGGINLVSRLSDEERRGGLICASTGNHGQSIAYASRTFDVRARIVVPEGSNPDKVAAMELLGAEVISHGRDFDEARLECERLAGVHGHRYVHSGNEHHLIAGVGTIGSEIMQDLPDLDLVIVPVGGGSGISGISIAVHGVRADVEVIGVQSEQAPAACRSWEARRPLELEQMDTFAEGLATRCGFELPQAIMREHLSDFVLVSDDEIRDALKIVLETTHNLAEPAAAAPIAAAFRLRDRIAGRRVAFSLSGANITLGQLRSLLSS
jgi:threonine dehydratase